MINVFKLSADIAPDAVQELRSIESLPEERDCVWVDLDDPTEAEAAVLAEVFQFHPLAIEDCWQGPQSPKVDDYGDYTFIVGKCANPSWKLKRLQTLWFDGIGRNNIKPVRERSRDEESVTFGEETQEKASAG